MNGLDGLDAKIRSLMQRLFDVDPAEVTDETRRGSLERWDSLGHLDLVESLGVEFGVEVTPEQALELETVADIKRLLRSLLKR